jgi:hypothetical protein
MCHCVCATRPDVILQISPLSLHSYLVNSRDDTYNFTGHQRTNFLVPEWGTLQGIGLIADRLSQRVLNDV